MTSIDVSHKKLYYCTKMLREFWYNMKFDYKFNLIFFIYLAININAVDI